MGAMNEYPNMAEFKITSAERARLSQLQRVALGYQPLRMKPVHLATSFLLALTGRYRILKWLNIAANPRTAAKREGDLYVAENLYPELSAEGLQILNEGVDMQGLKLLRQHLNAAFNNDGAALSPAFPPYSTFGGDYSTPSLAYLANQSKNHGHAGAFLWLILNQSDAGRHFLSLSAGIIGEASSTAGFLGNPLVEGDEQAFDDDLAGLCGNPPLEFLSAVSDLMRPQTEALHRLARHLSLSPSVYALRNLILGLGGWLLTYQIRHVPGCADSVLFCDFAGDTRRRLRDQSAACYSRHLGLFGRSLHLWLEKTASVVADTDRALLERMEAKITKGLEDHFRDFSERIGWVQPRSGTANKYFRPLPDTMRVLLMSVLEGDEICTIDEIALRLRDQWQLVLGLLPTDHTVLRNHGYGPLDEDADLRANRDAFKRLAKHLGLAWEPSDGLVLFSLSPDRLI